MKKAKGIFFYNEDVDFKLFEKLKIKRWLKTIIEKENCELGEINYIFCSDAYLLQMNQDYLKHDTYTDIITFDYCEKTKTNLKRVSGDIFISIDRISENAEKFQTGFKNELKRVVAHGALHLIGYKDKKKEDKQQMTAKENESLELYECI
jgi:probable rRNA maturation factor